MRDANKEQKPPVSTVNGEKSAVRLTLIARALSARVAGELAISLLALAPAVAYAAASHAGPPSDHSNTSLSSSWSSATAVTSADEDKNQQKAVGPSAKEVPLKTLAPVVVVGKTKTENLQSIPASVAVVTASQMKKLHVERLSGSVRYLANVRIVSPDDPENTGVLIRGVGNGSHVVGFSNRVGVYIDGVYVGESPALNQDMLGISSVEVFRGPQGTLFGQNTEAGAIDIITRRPSHTFEGTAQLGIGNLGLRQAQLRLSGPLADGIYGSVTVGRTYRNGFVHDVTNGIRLGDRNNYALRSQLEIDRVPHWKIYATGDFMRSDQYPLADGRAISNPLGTGFPLVPTSFYQVSSDHVERAPRELWGGSVEADYSFANNMTFRSISSYRDTRYFTSSDLDYSPLPLAYVNYQFRYKQFTQEFQLLSPKDSRLSYVIGTYFYRLDAENRRDVIFGQDGPLFGIPAGSVAPLYATDRTTSASLYGNVTYRVNSKWSLEGGVRYIHDRQTAFWTVNTTIAPQLGLASGVYHGATPRVAWTPTITATYRLTNATSLYARYAKGYKTGGFNMDFVAASIFPDHIPFGPEHSNDYEVGFKSQFLENRARVNGSFFLTNYYNYQLDQYIFTGTSTQITIANVGAVQTKGAEVDGSLLAAPGLTLNASLGYLDAFFVNYPDATLDGQNYDGHRLPDASRFTGSVGVEFSHPVTRNFYGDAALRVSYRSGEFSTPANSRSVMLGDVSVPYDYFGGRWLVDGSYTVTPTNGDWDISVWARNLLGKKYLDGYFQDFFGTYVATPAEPRTYGITATYHF